MYSCQSKLSERKFQPNYKSKPLTVKFYARHDNTGITGHNVKQYEYFANEIERRLKAYDRDLFNVPVTENQTYGWLERFAEKYSGLDLEILTHKVPYDEMMNIMKQISFDIYRLKKLSS